jgi:hypothetical protein
MPLSLIALLPWMCVLGNFPPFTKKIRTPSNMTAMPIKANVNNNVTHHLRFNFMQIYERFVSFSHLFQIIFVT